MPKKYRDASTDEVGGPDGWIHHEHQGTVDPLGGFMEEGRLGDISISVHFHFHF